MDMRGLAVAVWWDVGVELFQRDVFEMSKLC